MGERGLLILLLAGLCGPASNQIRKHVFVPITLSWSLAQTYCREQHTDLATVCSQEEAEQLLTQNYLSLILPGSGCIVMTQRTGSGLTAMRSSTPTGTLGNQTICLALRIVRL
ncbi:C-type lectin-like [Huso huso]|uniref:C-type lectin-like n=1 Tax=Huso huso TaxID=61971 RepID=A0ABR0YAV7_HUSHU